MRSSGGAVGLAVSSAILANVLKSSLPPRLSSVANSTFAAPNLSTFSPADREIVANAYADASRAVFIWCVPLTGLCLVLCIFIKDHGLIREEEKEAPTPPAGAVVQSVDAGVDGEKSQPQFSQHPVELADRTMSSSPTSPNISRKPSLSSVKSGKSELQRP